MSIPSLGYEEAEALNKVIASGWITSHREVLEFEKEIAHHHGQDYGVACNSGGTALHLALVSLGVGPGDEVVIPALTMIAVANAVLMCGAQPVIADAWDDFGNPSIETILPCLSSRTKVVIVAHAYGQPVSRMKTLCSEVYPAVVVEDCSQAHYATQNQRSVGSFGTLSTFSFYANKIITCGEGGMVIGSDIDLQKTLRSLRHHGFGEDRFTHERMAYSYRMTEMQAAIGRVQHSKHNAFIQKRKQIRQWYEARLDNYPVLEEGGVPWVMPVLSDNKEGLIGKLKEANIECRKYFTPMTDQPHIFSNRLVPKADELYQKALCLPIYYSMEESDVEKICSIIR